MFYLNDILLSIVGGAIIMLLTAIIEYLSFKRKNMENLMKKITEYEKFFFNINYLKQSAQNIFIKYFNGVLDTILGKIRRKYSDSDGDTLVDEGKEAMMSCDEDVMNYLNVPIFIYS